MPRSIMPPVRRGRGRSSSSLPPSASSSWRSANSIRKVRALFDTIFFCAIGAFSASVESPSLLLSSFSLTVWTGDKAPEMGEGVKQEACSGVIGTNDSHNPLSLPSPVLPSLDAVSLSVLPWGPFPLSSPLFVGGRRTCLGREGSESSSCSLTC